MPTGNFMQQLGGVMSSFSGVAANQRAATTMDVAAASQVNPGARMSGRECNEARQRERKRAADEALICRKKSIQAAMQADQNITRRKLEDMLDEEERNVNDAN